MRPDLSVARSQPKCPVSAASHFAYAPFLDTGCEPIWFIGVISSIWKGLRFCGVRDHSSWFVSFVSIVASFVKRTCASGAKVFFVGSFLSANPLAEKPPRELFRFGYQLTKVYFHRFNPIQ